MSTETPRQQLITQMPLKSLWGNDDAQYLLRGINLDSKGIRELLRQGEVQFVVANCGFPPQWIPSDQCFDFWKSEIQEHLVDVKRGGFNAEEFPDSYAYVASFWSSPDGRQVVLLEMQH